MAEKNDRNFIAFCDELRAYVSENKHFPNKHTRLLNKIKFVRRKIQSGYAGGVETENVPRHSGDEGYGRAYRRAKEEAEGTIKVSYVCLFRHQRKRENILPEYSNYIS